MDDFCTTEIRWMISICTNIGNKEYYFVKNNNSKPHYINYRKRLVRTIKHYINKYYTDNNTKNSILYLSIIYLDLILSKNHYDLNNDTNGKYICLCSFLISLKFSAKFNLAAKIVHNFCKNYSKDYKIYENQIVHLLDYNLIYATSFDFLKLISNNNFHEILTDCEKILYDICEENFFTDYSPFFISVAVFRYVKEQKYLNHKHNHYDKYFDDNRVNEIYNQICEIYQKKEKINCSDNLSNLTNLSFSKVYNSLSNSIVNLNNYSLSFYDKVEQNICRTQRSRIYNKKKISVEKSGISSFSNKTNNLNKNNESLINVGEIGIDDKNRMISLKKKLIFSKKNINNNFKYRKKNKMSYVGKYLERNDKNQEIENFNNNSVNLNLLHGITKEKIIVLSQNIMEGSSSSYKDFCNHK